MRHLASARSAHVFALVLSLFLLDAARVHAYNCSAQSVPRVFAGGPDSASNLLTSISHDLCVVSAQCSRRFFVRPPPARDDALFAFLVGRMFDEIRVNASLVLAALCGDANTTTGAPSTRGVSIEAPLWMLLLDNYNFCTDNEIPDETAGCVCRPDKVCHETPGDDFEFSRGTFRLLITAFIGLVCYFSFKNSQEIAALDARVSQSVAPPTASSLLPVSVQFDDPKFASLQLNIHAQR